MVSDLKEIKERLLKLHGEFMQIVIDLLEYEKSLDEKDEHKKRFRQRIHPISSSKIRVPSVSGTVIQPIRYPPKQKMDLKAKGELKP